MSKRAFTLLEVIVAIGILSLISIVISQVFLSTTRANRKAELMRDIKQNGDFAAGILTRSLQGAKSITSTCVSAGPLPASTISFVDNTDVATTFTCDAVSNQIKRTVGGVDSFLTSQNVQLQANSCSFTCQSFSDDPSEVIFKFTLEQKNASPDTIDKAQSSFTGKITLRNQ